MPDLVTAPGSFALARDSRLERLVVVAPGPDPAEYPAYGLDVVVQRVGLRRHDDAQRGPVAVEVRDKHLDLAARNTLAHLAHALREDEGAAVREVVAVHRCDDGVVQAHPLDRLGEPCRLLQVESQRLAGGDRAVAAGAGADVAQDHERRGAALPALPYVRAVRLLADRVELVVAHQRLQRDVVGAARHSRREPVREPPFRGHRHLQATIISDSIGAPGPPGAHKGLPLSPRPLAGESLPRTTIRGSG